MIRKYKKSDTDIIINIWYKASLLAHPFLTSEFFEQEKINIKEIYLTKSKTWVYVHDKNVVGFISMIDNEVGAIFVYPEFHGKGFGKQLMDFVISEYGDLTVEVFEKNQIGRAFYDRYGFIQIKEYFHEDSNQKILRLQCNSFKN